MRNMTRIFLPLLALLLASSQAQAIDVTTGTEDFTLHVDSDLQFRNENTWGGPKATATSTGAAPSGHTNIDFFLRRASLAVRGTAFQFFTYYLKLETGSFGKRGDYSSPSLIQDMFVGVAPTPGLNIEAGFLKTPLSRPAVDSSPRSNSLEGVSDILFYPNTRAQRQNGAQMRLLMLDKRVLIRGGFYEGARTGVSGGKPVTVTATTSPLVNPQGIPMSAGMVRYNLIGSDDAYTYPAIYLDGSTHVSFGVGGQYQPHSGGVKNAATSWDYSALAADIYADVGLPGDMEALLILDGYRFDWGDRQTKTGNGLHGETGFRFGAIEPTANFYWFNSETRTNSFLKLAGGLNYYIRKHNAKIMAEYSGAIAGGVLPDTPGKAATPRTYQVLLQSQIAF
jgi:hypothetical protein